MDFTDLTRGNPGVGGTEFLFIMLCKYLSMQEGIDVTVYHFNDNIIPGGNKVKVSSEEEAFAYSAENEDTIFILKNLQDDSVYNMLSKYKSKYIIWCHNFLTYQEMKFFKKENNIKRVIAVGRQMYDYYIDEPVIDKMDYVFNFFLPPAKNKLRIHHYEPNVTYVGSLIYQKSFHVLAAAWKKIIEQVPDAKLHVIGSGKLYNRDNKLGELGVAEASYEEMFLQYLRDDDGKMLDSVVFHGLMGDDKFDIYENTAVGVVNPLASTETFCLCAVEMESVGIPIVSRRKNGLLDTIIDGETGILYDDADNELADCVIRLLKDEELNKKLGEGAREFSSKEFLPEIIIRSWLNVINDVNGDKKALYHKPENHMSNNGKSVRKFIHGLHRCPLLKWIPSIHDLQKK